MNPVRRCGSPPAGPRRSSTDSDPGPSHRGPRIALPCSSRTESAAVCPAGPCRSAGAFRPSEPRPLRADERSGGRDGSIDHTRRSRRRRDRAHQRWVSEARDGLISRRISAGKRGSSTDVSRTPSSTAYVRTHARSRMSCHVLIRSQPLAGDSSMPGVTLRESTASRVGQPADQGRPS